MRSVAPLPKDLLPACDKPRAGSTKLRGRPDESQGSNPALLAGNVVDRVGHAAVALAAGARPGVALAGWPGRDLGAGRRGAGPAGVAGLAGSAAPGGRRGPPRAWRCRRAGAHLE